MRMTELCGKDMELHRFFCRCGAPDHVMEIMICDGQIEIQYYGGGRCGRSFFDRIKMAAGLLFMKKTPSWSEFIVREEDEAEISNLLNFFKDKENRYEIS